MQTDLSISNAVLVINKTSDLINDAADSRVMNVYTRMIYNNTGRVNRHDDAVQSLGGKEGLAKLVSEAFSQLPSEQVQNKTIEVVDFFQRQRNTMISSYSERYN